MKKKKGAASGGFAHSSAGIRGRVKLRQRRRGKINVRNEKTGDKKNETNRTNDTITCYIGWGVKKSPKDALRHLAWKKKTTDKLSKKRKTILHMEVKPRLHGYYILGIY